MENHMPNASNGQTFNTIEDKIDDLLLDSRRIFISEQVDNDTSRDLIRRLWYLDLKDPGKPITFIINSPGGSVASGFAIWDVIKTLRSPVRTLVTGMAASMGSILSIVAPKGSRFATPNSRIMVHQPLISGVVKGQATDLEIHAKEIIRTRDRLINIYCTATGKSFEEIERVLDRDSWMSAEEALAFGLLDGIVNNADELEKALK